MSGSLSRTHKRETPCIIDSDARVNEGLASTDRDIVSITTNDGTVQESQGAVFCRSTSESHASAARVEIDGSLYPELSIRTRLGDLPPRRIDDQRAVEVHSFTGSKSTTAQIDGACAQAVGTKYVNITSTVIHDAGEGRVIASPSPVHVAGDGP